VECERCSLDEFEMKITNANFAAGFHSSSFIPEGYSYIGRNSQADNTASETSKQQAPNSAFTPFRSTGYVAHIDAADLKKRSGRKQRSVDMSHETLLFTHEGHMYTKP